mgnify:CR=1 FL=1|tara:strand:- start:768 stop:980 length:213 start_codon:yes stop_codon:yes gene_type:complete
MHTVDRKLAKALVTIDSWLKEQQSTDLTNVVEASREAITEIQTRGYYLDYEKDLLNELRRQYLEDVKSNN